MLGYFLFFMCMFEELSNTFLEYIDEYEKIKDSKTLYNYYVKNLDFIKNIKKYEKLLNG